MSADDKKKQKRKLAKAIAEKDKGNAAFAKGEYLQAVQAFSEAIKIDPENHTYFSNRSAAYAKLEKYDESEADARRCIALKPDFVKGYARYGAALFAKGDAVKAIEAYKQGLTHDAADKLCKEGLFQCQLHMESIDKQKAEEAKWTAEAERQKKVVADREMAAFQAQKAAAAAAAAAGADTKTAAAPAASAAPAGGAGGAAAAAAPEEDAKHAAQLTGQGYGQSALRSDAEYQEFLKWKQSKEYAKYAADATAPAEAKAGAGADGKAAGGAGAAGDAKAATEYVIGIDLGTTYSCVGVWKDDKVEIIADAHGSRTTPSYIGLLPNGERIIGEPAKSRQAAFPKNVLYDIKRMIGQRFTDAGVAKDIRHFPFKVVEGPDSKPQVEVDFENKTSKRFDPEALSAMVLGEMKTIAETYLGTAVRKAVITVPAYFSDAQRNATKAAGAIAGLEVLRIINEPTAAALSYGLDLHSLGKKKRVNTLIFDLGGGTFDVSLITIEGGIFEVKAIGGDTHLGGEDFDQNVVQHLIAEVKTAGCDKDVTADLKAMKRLRAASEKAKRELSNSQTADIKIENLVQDFDFTHRLTRQKFNELNNNLFLRCIDTVKHVMKDARMKTEDINEVVLVGGSTRIPKVQELLSKYSNGKELCKSVNPDEAVAYGATVQAAILSGVRTKATKDVLLMDVTPLSLGIETVGRVMSVIIPRNSSIPTVKTQTYTTEENFQTAVDVCVYEGERLKTEGNNLLGKFTIKGIERAKRGEPQIDVSFSIDSDGILTVSAKDQKTGAVAQIEIKNRSQMNKEQLDKLVAEAERYKKEDEERLKRVEARNELERVINEVLDIVNDLQSADDPTNELMAEAKGADGAAAGAGAGKKKGKGKGGVVSKKKAEENKKLAGVLEAAATKTQEWLDQTQDAKPGEIALKRRELERRVQSFRK